jgi:hypothetical protein
MTSQRFTFENPNKKGEFYPVYPGLIYDVETGYGILSLRNGNSLTDEIFAAILSASIVANVIELYLGWV